VILEYGARPCARIEVPDWRALYAILDGLTYGRTMAFHLTADFLRNVVV